MALRGAVWLFLLTQGAGGRQALLKWTALNAFVLLLGVPYYLRAFTASKSGVISYMPPAGIHQIVYCASLIVSGIVTPYPWPAFLLAAAVFVTSGRLVVLPSSLKPGKSHPDRRTFLYLALVVVLSQARPILLPRILVWAVVPLCLIAGNQLLAAGRARVVSCLV